MKQIIFAIFAMMTAVSAYAANNNCSLLDDNCDDDNEPEYRVCTAIDGQGEVFKYYTPTWWDSPYTKKQALKECKTKSEAPGTCKVTGCVEY